jgi:uncharacterized protein (DUF2252 family)
VRGTCHLFYDRMQEAGWTTFAAAYDAGLCQPAPPME